MFATPIRYIFVFGGPYFCAFIKVRMSDAVTGARRITRALSRDSPLMTENNVTLQKKPPIKTENKHCTFIEYKGAIKYFHEYTHIAAASDDIIKWLDNQVDRDVCPMAFDMEWPFNFQTGPQKSAVIQICVDLTCCYIFQVTNLSKLPVALLSLLKHPKVRLHGVNIKNDFRKLARDFAGVDADELISKCVDLSVWCNSVCETRGRWSLDRLSRFIIKKTVDKNKKVRMSKWQVIPLSQTQLLYAAIDVYIGQLIYLELDRCLKAKEANAIKFKNEHGDVAYKAMKALGETFLNLPTTSNKT